MFFKQKLHIMGGVFKEHLNAACDRWRSKIEKKGEARIDISKVFERIFAHTITHICFGDDFNDDRFMIFYYNPNSGKFTEQEVNVTEAMHNMTE